MYAREVLVHAYEVVLLVNACEMHVIDLDNDSDAELGLDFY
jgi:hypothetical protein